jgi:hypothetical protein
MDKRKGRWSLERLIALAAIAVGLTAGSYGIASAAGGSGSSSSQSAAAQNPWGH